MGSQSICILLLFFLSEAFTAPIWKKVPDQYTCSKGSAKNETVQILLDSSNNFVHLYGKIVNGQLTEINGIVAAHAAIDFLESQAYEHRMSGVGYESYQDFLGDAGYDRGSSQQGTSDPDAAPVYVETRPGALIKSRDDNGTAETRPGARISSRDDIVKKDTRAGAQIRPYGEAEIEASLRKL